MKPNVEKVTQIFLGESGEELSEAEKDAIVRRTAKLLMISKFDIERAISGKDVRLIKDDSYATFKSAHNNEFNSRDGVLIESILASLYIKNHDIFFEPIKPYFEKLADIFDRIAQKPVEERSDFETHFVELVYKDISREGQFGGVSAARDKATAISSIFSEPNDSINIISKTLIMKAVGAVILDSVQSIGGIGPLKSQKFIAAIIINNLSTLLETERGHDIESLNHFIEDVRPSPLFGVRGRSGMVKSFNADKYGIIAPEDQLTLSAVTSSFLSKDTLSLRPLFRCFTTEKGVISPFVNSKVDADAPLAGSISGSSSCISMIFNLLKDRDDTTKPGALIPPIVAFLVGGGYHSTEEVTAVLPTSALFKG